MHIILDNYSFYSSYNSSELPTNKIPIVFIHGFSGSSQDWSEVAVNIDNRFIPIAIDLFGHGQSDSPDEIHYYSSDGINRQIRKVFDYYKISRAVICGYSMGGRAALTFALNNTSLLKGLILESTTPGIIDIKERKQRVEDDSKLANKIIENGLESFVNYWQNLPIFSSQKGLTTEKLEKLRNQILSNSKSGLAKSLTGFSTGKMPNYWNQLQQLTIPVKLIVGNLDSKYVTINQNLIGQLSNSSLSLIENCGHNTHLEKPAEFVSLINHFIGNLFN